MLGTRPTAWVRTILVKVNWETKILSSREEEADGEVAEGTCCRSCTPAVLAMASGQRLA